MVGVKQNTYNTNRYKNACRYTTGKYDIYEMNDNDNEYYFI